MKLWEHEKEERLEYFPAKNRTHETSLLIFPGGAYAFLADHEGRGYAEFFSSHGYDCYVCYYRVAPDRFPLPLIDARRALRLVRARQGGRVVVMGSSAGGNLAALLSTCALPLEEGCDGSDVVFPDGQALCYPVISLERDDVTDYGSRVNLLGEDRDLYRALSPETHINRCTPPAFLWHTADDESVSVMNTLLYCSALQKAGVPVEAHIFPHGYHGLGLATDDRSVGQWTGLFLSWLEELENGSADP